MNYAGALLTTGWTIYLIYGSAGIAYAALSLLIFGAILRFGASPLFVLSSCVLYFHFDAFGIWILLLSCVAAAAAFYSDLKRYRMHQTSGK